jgi:Protein of unknown function (DUF3592)
MSIAPRFDPSPGSHFTATPSTESKSGSPASATTASTHSKCHRKRIQTPRDFRLTTTMINPSITPFLIVNAIGALSLLCGAVAFSFARASKSWPTTKGTVVKSFVEVDEYLQNRRRTWVKFSYKYSVGGNAYTSSLVNGGGAISTVDVLVNAAKRLPVGTEVDVYYWPAFPRFACLCPGIYSGGITLIIIAAIFFGIGMFMRYLS